MNRRSFLTALSAAVAGAALDPEKLLWVPGKKRIFIPAPCRNQLLTPPVITAKMLAILEEHLDFHRNLFNPVFEIARHFDEHVARMPLRLR